MRVIEYTVTSEGSEQSQTFRLVTTILDPEPATALELAGAYQQRWEYEISLREIETQLLESEHGLRSKTPELIRQEFWGLLLAHYAIRALSYDQLARYVGTRIESAVAAGAGDYQATLENAAQAARRWATQRGTFTQRWIEVVARFPG